jgi:hypothetical protein
MPWPVHWTPTGRPGDRGEADRLDDVLRGARLDDGGGRGADGDVPRGGQPGVQVLAGQGERAGEAAAQPLWRGSW